MQFLESTEAAAYLGVKVTTLYAYVSRGLLESVRSASDPRRRAYRKSDLDRLKQRSDAHAGESAAAGGALRWGAPVLDTAISEITPAGPEYRGYSARGLARDGYPFESVAELLWTGARDHHVQWAVSTVSTDPVSAAHRPLDRMRLKLALAEFSDVARFAPSRDAQLECARRVITTLAGVLGFRGDGSIARGLARALATEGDERLFDAALIAVADHELNASTFATRVTASTGAGLYPSVAAGLAAVSGPLHGGAGDRCEALIDEVLNADAAMPVLMDRVSRGDTIPGFGHPLYSLGDPRWQMIVSRLGVGARPDVIEAVDEIVEATRKMELGHPAVDFGLATLVRSLELPKGSSSALFALGRTAGWIAHALEQYDQGFILRPRANYVGSVHPTP